MKITNVKAMVAKVMTVGLLAGAVVMAAPAAQAQVRVGIGIGVRGPVYGGPAYGGPVYAAPVYGRGYGYGYGYGYPGYYGRREVIVRHDDWRRGRDFDRDRHYGYYGR
ncbi:hypothetical protein [Granulicella tundricola]|uniref:Uncharacterized protein n=1 Tax=Granulicella tundricola (strain ATCC BAA-1859 / DSM 23138 / MP5ACTX9) TaxID=1198114 RepID=E8WXX7_GRATM|nr:hypothetical protein [Granulicella tundricola]ADW67516.1 hypothetical protein AciX9_0444 [Granulicella tundricola MP5ACTX9]